MMHQQVAITYELENWAISSFENGVKLSRSLNREFIYFAVPKSYSSEMMNPNLLERFVSL